LIGTSVNVGSSGLAVYDADDAVKTSSNNGLSGSDDILFNSRKTNRKFQKQKTPSIVPCASEKEW